MNLPRKLLYLARTVAPGTATTAGPMSATGAWLRGTSQPATFSDRFTERYQDA